MSMPRFEFSLQKLLVSLRNQKSVTHDPFYVDRWECHCEMLAAVVAVNF